ncbi:type I restriction endonuclease subunit R [uncultured Meiothermus sp.]|uniref:type I restriction endonuclease subunit R n=1 Tax=uncultured Meiothermus sp. TaxID=157471 RepID=UPI0026204615|nr:type I restriction endonuclease subunit R [uncultured Meiothermus sp.]
MNAFSENTVEQATLEWLRSMGYEYQFGPSIAPEEPKAERESYRQVLLLGRLRDALVRLNPGLPQAALDEAIRKIGTLEHPSLMQNNRAFHRMLTDGLEVEILWEGQPRGYRVQLLDYASPDNNNWLAVNQFTIQEGPVERRPDVLVFLNGIPVAIFELKNLKDERATVGKAYDQLQTYAQQIPRLFVYNVLQVISDGLAARLGCLGADFERFLAWKTVTGQEVLSESLETLTKGVFDRARLLQLIRHFVTFEDDTRNISKKLAAYHQFHAVQKALDSVKAASQGSAEEGKRGRGGVIWHTQGSGKSLTMTFFAGRLVLEPALQNPTIVVITDRNDLDDQLFDTFSYSAQLLRQQPVQAESRAHLRKLLAVQSGGVVFTTIQKFLPEERGDKFPTLSERSNVVVLVDEAHRTQYGFAARVDELGRTAYGFARNLRDALPNATYVGFTGTPIEFGDVRNTRAVFGDYIDIYDIERAIADNATRPIFYESRLARLSLEEAEKPKLDQQFEEVTENEERESRERLKSRWAQLEALVGTPKRIGQIADDLVRHFEQRQTALKGKGMIVCMSRRICVDLYNALTQRRPQWHHPADDKGFLKVVMTGSASDPAAWQAHIRSKARTKEIARRFRDPGSDFGLVIVRDMWLTGLDVPSLHTMYLDKPMQGHNLMQAIARVNRVFKDKPGGLVVDYIGIASSLREALAVYTQSGGQGQPVLDQDLALRAFEDRLSVCRGLFHGFDYTDFLEGTPAEKLEVLRDAQDFILDPKVLDGRERFLKAATELAQAFALIAATDEGARAQDEVAFFLTVRAALAKPTESQKQQARADLGAAIQQLIDKAIAPTGVIDIFEAAGLQKPDISILSESFLAEVRQMPQRNLAVEMLERLLSDEIRLRSKKNLIESRAFSEKLLAALAKYQNRAIETAQVIEELIALAREMRESRSRGERLGLSEDEIAFYDALEVNDSAVQVMGDEALKTIARELAETVRKNTTIDWSVREQVRANLRRLVKRVLRKHGYPPDRQEKAARVVLEQAELLVKAEAEET